MYKLSEREVKTEVSTEDILTVERYLSIFSNKVYLVYGDKLAIECDINVNIKKGITINKLIEQENYKELLNKLNNIMPEKMEKYVLGQETDSNVITLEMPYLETEAGKYISSVDVNEMFNENYYKNSEIKKNKIIVDIMNATGDTSYAKRIGKYLSKKYGYIISNTENDSKSDYSYVIGLDVEEEELTILIRGLREKYIKIGTKPQMNTMAKIVVVLGDDKVTDFKIKVFSQNGASVHTAKIKARGYSNIEKIKTKKLPEEDKIVYNAEDYYTALKIAELLGITVFEQDNSKKNIIEVYITGGE